MTGEISKRIMWMCGDFKENHVNVFRLVCHIQICWFDPTSTSSVTFTLHDPPPPPPFFGGVSNQKKRRHASSWLAPSDFLWTLCELLWQKHSPFFFISHSFLLASLVWRDPNRPPDIFSTWWDDNQTWCIAFRLCGDHYLERPGPGRAFSLPLGFFKRLPGQRAV